MYYHIQLWYTCIQVNDLIKIALYVLNSFEDISISQIYGITTVYIIILFDIIAWMKLHGEKVGARVILDNSLLLYIFP